MKKLLWGMVLMVVSISMIFAKNAGSLIIYNERGNQRYQNGDEIKMTLESLQTDEYITSISMVKMNYLVKGEKPRSESRLIEDYQVSGGDIYIRLKDLDVNDNWIQFFVITNKRVYLPGDQVIYVSGDLPEPDIAMAPGATFSITDTDAGTFDTNDQITASGSGFDANEGIASELFRELDGDAQLITSTSPSTSTLAIDGSGNLSGSATRNGTSFDANTVFIDYLLLLGGSTPTTTSSNTLTATESNPPTFISARTISTTQIEVTFDEPVNVPSVNADAIDNWTVTGFTVSSVSDLGSSVSTCTLTVSTPFNRGATPSVSFTTGTNEYEDGNGNDAETVSGITPSDAVPPGAVTLFIHNDTDALTLADFIGSDSSVTLIAHVAEGVSDATLDGVVFEGSDDGSAWTTIGTSTTQRDVGSDVAGYSVSWDVTQTTNQFKMLRARAFDGAGAGGINGTEDGDDNSTQSSAIGSSSDGNNLNFEDTYRVQITDITPTTITAGTGSDRAAITYQLQDNYGNQTNTLTTTTYYGFTDDSSTETWWNASSGSDQLDQDGVTRKDTLLVGVSQGIVYYSNSTSGSYTISVQQVSAGEAISDGTDTYATPITVNAGSFDHFDVALEIAGDKDTDNSFNITITAVDAGNNTITSYSPPANGLYIFSNANQAPDATNPTFAGVSSFTDRSSDTTDAKRWDIPQGSVSFTNGVATVSVTLPAVQSNVWITAEENDGTGDYTSNTQSYGTGLFNVTSGVLADFIFSPSSGTEFENVPIGAYTLTAVDGHQNTITSFAGDVTLSVATGLGTGDIEGLSGAGNDQVLGTAFVSGVADLSNMRVLRTDGDASGTYTINANFSSVNSSTDLSLSLSRRQATLSNFSPAANAHVNAAGTPNTVTLQCDIDLDEEANLSDNYQVIYKFSSSTNDTVGGTLSGDLTVSGGTLSFVLSSAALQAGASQPYLNWGLINTSTDNDATLFSGNTIVTQIVNPTLVISPTSGNGDISDGGFTPGVEEGAVAFQLSSQETGASLSWHGITVNVDGSYSASDVDAISVYQDNGTIGAFEPGTDTQIGTAAVNTNGSGTITITLTSDQTITNSASSFLLTVTANASASGANTFRVFIQNTGSNLTLTEQFVNSDDQSLYDRVFSPDANIGMTTEQSLPVTLSSFQAIGDYGKVLLQWITESEIDNQGFYVYRSEERNGNYTKLNNQMIPGHQTTNERHEYSYEDKTVEEGKSYYYKLISLDIDGKVNEYGDIVSAEVKVTPKVFTLHQNYPNPFNPTTKFNFDVPRETEISLIVYNALGQEVKRILDRQLLSPGNYTNYQWDATNEQGIPVPGGIYFVRMIAHKFNYQKTMKMIYLK